MIYINSDFNLLNVQNLKTKCSTLERKLQTNTNYGRFSFSFFFKTKDNPYINTKPVKERSYNTIKDLKNHTTKVIIMNTYNNSATIQNLKTLFKKEKHALLDHQKQTNNK